MALWLGLDMDKMGCQSVRTEGGGTSTAEPDRPGCWAKIKKGSTGDRTPDLPHIG